MDHKRGCHHKAVEIGKIFWGSLTVPDLWHVVLSSPFPMKSLSFLCFFSRCQTFWSFSWLKLIHPADPRAGIYDSFASGPELAFEQCPCGSHRQSLCICVIFWCIFHISPRFLQHLPTSKGGKACASSKPVDIS